MTDDTQEAPERIFATGNATTGSWNAAPVTFRGPVEIEYVRADRIEELEAERDALKAKLEKVVCFVTEIEAGPSWGDSLPIWVNAQMLKARAIFAELKGQDDE